MNQPVKGATLSSQSNYTQYQISVQADQSDGSGVFNVQLNLFQEADFGDAEAAAMLAGITALVPPAWSPYPTMLKTATDQTTSTWNATTQAFE